MLSAVEEFILAVPKAELHIHIEGSLEPELLFALSKKNSVTIPYETIDELREAYNFDDLDGFLKLYYSGMSVLITESDFAQLAHAYTRRMHEEGVVHAEPFFDPQAHVDRGVSMRTVYEGLRQGFDLGKREFGVTIDLIFSFLRHTTEESCLQWLRQDTEEGHYTRQLFRDGAFKAVGLDSSEVGNPPEKFSQLFRYCREVLHVPHTVAHAGEEGPAEYIWSAMTNLCVSRIDHGVACRTDVSLRKHLRKLNMPLTVCPTSNVALKVFGSRRECASVVGSLLREGLCVTLSSDDPAYFGGYVAESYRMLAQELPDFTCEEMAQLAKNSITASFMSSERKTVYCQQIDALCQKVLEAHPGGLCSGLGILCDR